MTANRIRRKFEVSTTTCNSSHTVRSIIVLAENRRSAIEIAIPKLSGPRTFWFEDSGLPGYGQVFEALRPTKNNSHPGSSSVTDRVALNVEPLSKKSRAFLKQEESDRRDAGEEYAWHQTLGAANQRGFDAGFEGQPMPTPLDGYDYRHISEMEAGYYDGKRVRREEKEDEAYQKRCHEENEDLWKREREAQEIAHNAQIATEHQARQQRINAEVERLRSIDVTQPCTDERLAQIIRNTIAPATYKHGMPLGEHKTRMLGGEYPELVREYLMSEAIYVRLENCID